MIYFSLSCARCKGLCFVLLFVTFFLSSHLFSQTILNRGDFAILALNANLPAPNSSRDDISFVCFKDITTGTQIQVTDNAYEGCVNGLWSGSEGGAILTRTGVTIPKGTVITLRTAPFAFVYPDANWTATNLSTNQLASALNMNAGGDQIYFAQGGTWAEQGTNCTINPGGSSRTDPNAIYPGNAGRILFGFSTSGSWLRLQQSSGESGLFPGMECFSMAPTGGTAYNKYTGPLTAATQTDWIKRVATESNWTSYSSSASFTSASPNFNVTNFVIPISSGGDIPTAEWVAPSSAICTNTPIINLNTLITTGATGGTWSGTGVTGNMFNPSGLNGDYNITYTINYNSGSAICPIAQTNTITVAALAAPVLTVIQPTCLVPTGSINVTPVAGITYSSNGVSFSSTTTFNNLSSNNTYTITAQNASGCKATATATINAATGVPAAPTLAVVNNCGNSTLTVTNFTGTLIWNDGGTGNSRTVTNAATYNVTQTVSGCTSTASNTVTTLPLATSTSSTPISICPSELPYTWNGTAYNTAGTYTKTLTNAVGCDSVATLVLTVKTTSTSSTPISICPSALPYTWNGTAYNTVGIYTRTLTNAVGCDSAATLVLTVKATSTSSTPISICPSALPYTWNGTAYNTAGTYTKTLTNAVGCDSAATLALTLKQPTTSTTNVTICAGNIFTWNGTIYNAAGTYTKTFTNAVGCDSIATLNLTIETFTISLSANPDPAFGGVAFTGQITANLPIASSIWQPSNLFVNNLSTQTIVAPDTSFTLVVTGVSANGCRSTASRLVTVVPSNNTIFIPNALTPAAVGTDASVIKVYGTTVKTAQLLVYNQWGQLIFQTDSATTKGWDGTFNGKAQPSGVYTYVVRVVYQNNKVETKSGAINLIR